MGQFVQQVTHCCTGRDDKDKNEEKKDILDRQKNSRTRSMMQEEDNEEIGVNHNREQNSEPLTELQMKQYNESNYRV